MVVAAAVVANAHVPPEVPHAQGAEHNIGIVKLVIVADPGADKSPGSLYSRVSTETGSLLGLALYTSSSKDTVLGRRMIASKNERKIMLTEGGAAPEVLGSKTGS